jgi:hypothetical protein
MIHLLWCTLRPSQFNRAHAQWIERADNSEVVTTYVAVNWKEHADEVKQYLDTSRNYVMVVNTNQIGVCYPSYQLSSSLGTKMGSCADGDIVVFASDDFLPPMGWDTYLLEQLSGKGEAALMVRDGYQLPDSSNMLHPAVTIPIMTYSCLRRMNGVIYHPSYGHMFSDCELYNNLVDLGLLIDNRMSDETVFEHMHHAAGKRNVDQADQMYHMRWAQDEVNWNKRRVLSIEDRIKIEI